MTISKRHLLFNELSEKQEIKLTYKVCLVENSPRAKRLWLKEDQAKKFKRKQVRIRKRILSFEWTAGC